MTTALKSEQDWESLLHNANNTAATEDLLVDTRDSTDDQPSDTALSNITHTLIPSHNASPVTGASPASGAAPVLELIRPVAAVEEPTDAPETVSPVKEDDDDTKVVDEKEDDTLPRRTTEQTEEPFPASITSITHAKLQSLDISSATDFFGQDGDTNDITGDATADTDGWLKESDSGATFAETAAIFNMDNAGDLEDEWAKEFGNLDESDEPNWENAFAEAFNDGEFLDEQSLHPVAATTTTQPVGLAASAYAPSNLPQNRYTRSPSIPVPVPVAVRQSPAASKPMEFFADLPTTRPVRPARRSTQTVVAQDVAAPLPPMVGSVAAPPLGNSTAAIPRPSQSATSSFQAFRTPEKLDPFPQQPSVFPSTDPTNEYGFTALSTQPLPVRNTRYSPSPSHVVDNSRIRDAKPSSPGVSKYSSSPSSLSAPTHSGPPRSKSPYAVAPKVARQPSYTPSPTASVTGFPPSRPLQQVESRPSTSSGTSHDMLDQLIPPPSRPVQPAQDLTMHNDLTSMPPPPPNRFAPRTSSPLAQFERAQQADGSIVETQRPRSSHSNFGRTLSGGSSSGPSMPQMSPLTSREARFVAASVPVISEAPVITASIISNPHAADITNFALPTDDTVADPLQRWHGKPIFAWSPGGLAVSIVPKHMAMYGGGQSAPLTKSMAGDAKIRKVKDFLVDSSSLALFPGPLKSKSKKKDIVAWISNYISHLEQETSDQRSEEKLLLWYLVRILVEHDGVLGGNDNVNLALKQIFAPQTNSSASQIVLTASERPSSDAPAVGTDIFLAEIRDSLLAGDRTKAVWHAVDNRQWGHAMLIASTLDPTITKQVTQEFVRKEVKKSGLDNLSIAALYETFVGNWEESVDELVPASARAGLQMVSTMDSQGQATDALVGLGKWKETVGLIMCNRSKDDGNTLLNLGRLLLNYGRIEAAHVCFICAQSLAKLGGADDASSDFVLLGVAIGNGEQAKVEAILLTELYEYAQALSSGQNMFPHLLAYKLQHALILAECGQRAEAQQYCDAIASAMKSSTRPSPYFHPTLVGQLDDLSRRLSQSPKDASSSWMSKPSIEKVSGSVWARFNSFVSGEEHENNSNGSGYQSENDAGPFARTNGGSPTISRSASGLDLFSTSNNNVPPANSRYAPSPVHMRSTNVEADRMSSGSFAGSPYLQPHSLSETQLGRPGSSGSMTSFGSPPILSHFPRQPSGLSRYQTVGAASTSTQSEGDLPRSRVPSYEPYVPSVSEEPSPAPSPAFGPIDEDKPAIGPYDSLSSANGIKESHFDESVPYEAEAEVDTPSGYEPSPGGYVPYEPGIEEEEEPSERQKKKTIFDEDDGGDVDGKADLRRKEKERKDREADEAVQRAAEADANRDSNKNKRASWLGGWFGGVKDPQAPTVHKAKLGDENSFYFDPETKRWVNKKAGATSTSPVIGATAPPPKGPPGRSVSGPPSASPQGGTGSSSGPPRMASPALSEMSLGTADVSAPPMLTAQAAGPPALGPPSRPTTSMSNASSIDDLIGGPAARKGGSVKKGKKGNRYVDVMAK